MKRLLVLALLLVASNVYAGDAEKAIAKLNSEFSAAVRAGDAAKVASYYADSAILMPPNSPQVKGPEAIKQWFAGMMAAGKVELNLTTDEVMQSGDMAVEIGRWDLTITPKDGAPMKDNGKYMVAFKKMKGEWKLVGDIFNTSMPAPQP